MCATQIASAREKNFVAGDCDGDTEMPASGIIERVDHFPSPAAVPA